MFFKPETTTVFETHSDVRKAFPNKSLPAVLTDETLAELGVYPVQLTTPQFDDQTQQVAGFVVQLQAGVWTQKWTIEDLPPAQREIKQAQFKEDFKRRVVEATQTRLDAFAKTKGYDDVNSAAKYKDITDEEIAALPAKEKALVRQFRAEARRLSVLTAHTWARLYVVLEEVESGSRAAPRALSEVEATLPQLTW